MNNKTQINANIVEAILQVIDKYIIEIPYDNLR